MILPIDFGDAKRLREFNPAALYELMAGTAHTKARFLDAYFQKTHMRKRAKTIPSRAWYPSTFPELQVIQESDAEGEHVIPEEPGWYEKGGELCALSLESFETRYDPVKDQWFYVDAVRLRDDQAIRLGVPTGSIIKSACLLCLPKDVLHK